MTRRGVDPHHGDITYQNLLRMRLSVQFKASGTGVLNRETLDSIAFGPLRCGYRNYETIVPSIRSGDFGQKFVHDRRDADWGSA